MQPPGLEGGSILHPAAWESSDQDFDLQAKLVKCRVAPKCRFPRHFLLELPRVSGKKKRPPCATLCDAATLVSQPLALDVPVGRVALSPAGSAVAQHQHRALGAGTEDPGAHPWVPGALCPSLFPSSVFNFPEPRAPRGRGIMVKPHLLPLWGTQDLPEEAAPTCGQLQHHAALPLEVHQPHTVPQGPREAGQPLGTSSTCPHLPEDTPQPPAERG